MIGLTDTLRQSASAEDELFEQIFMHPTQPPDLMKSATACVRARCIPDSYSPMSIPIDR